MYLLPTAYVQQNLPENPLTVFLKYYKVTSVATLVLAVQINKSVRVFLGVGI